MVAAVGLSGAGCARDVAHSPVAPRAERVGDAIEWRLGEHGTARATVVGERSLRVVARRHTGEEFGFVLRPGGFEEWASDVEGRRDELSCQVIGDRERYVLNGQGFELGREDLGRYASFGDAIRAQIRTKRPYETSLLVDNDLANELIRSLEELGRDPSRIEGGDPELAAQVIGPDGRCTSEFLQVVSACVRLKCMYGGPSNALCNACTGALVGCAIITIARGLGLG